VLADGLAVDEDVRAVVGGADVEEGAVAGLGGVAEVALVPERALVEPEPLGLGVPVAGNFDGGALGEALLYELVGVGRVDLILEVAVGIGSAVKGGDTGAVGIGDDVPVAIEGLRLAVVDVDEELLLGGRGGARL